MGDLLRDAGRMLNAGVSPEGLVSMLTVGARSALVSALYGKTGDLTTRELKVLNRMRGNLGLEALLTGRATKHGVAQVIQGYALWFHRRYRQTLAEPDAWDAIRGVRGAGVKTAARIFAYAGMELPKEAVDGRDEAADDDHGTGLDGRR